MEPFSGARNEAQQRTGANVISLRIAAAGCGACLWVWPALRFLADL